LPAKPSSPQSPRPFRFPSPLYAIVDTLDEARRSHIELAEALLACGVPLLQLRMKQTPTRRFVEVARQVQARCAAAKCLLIVNDRTDIAKLIGAAGVHLGQDDLSPQAARGILGPDKIIGLSTHTLEQAEVAATSGVADYLGFGPIFTTTSKQNPDPVVGLDGLREVRRRVSLPVVAIGGITPDTAMAVRRAGADAVAMISVIARTADVGATVRILLAQMSD
jgi:thiamine-phosphate pyrophosphorylase